MRGLFICLVIVLLLGSCVPLKDDISINPLTIIKHFTKKNDSNLWIWNVTNEHYCNSNNTCNWILCNKHCNK